MSLLHDGQQRLLGALARLQEARDVAALADLGDLRQLQQSGQAVDGVMLAWRERHARARQTYEQ
jgi:hypothetical protein